MSNSMDLARQNIANVIDTKFKPTGEDSHAALETVVNDLIRAFGNCTICWGKGYSTTFQGQKISPDFEGDQPYYRAPKVEISFCNCDRGKQLKTLWPTQA